MAEVRGVESFTEVVNPDLMDVSALMRANWLPPCWLYDPEIVAMRIARPTADPELVTGLRAGDGRLATYLAFLPVSLRVGELHARGVFASFLTASRDFRRQRLSDRQQLLAIDKAQARAYDYYVAVTIAGTPANQVVARAFAARGLPVRAVTNFHYLVAQAPALRARVGGPQRIIREYDPRDEARAWALLNAAGDRAELAQEIARADVDFLLRTRARVATYCYEGNEGIEALLHVSFIPVVRAGEVAVNAYIEIAAFGALSPPQREGFVAGVLAAVLRDHDVEAVWVPDTGSMDIGPFRRLGLRMAPRKFRLLLAPLRSGLALPPAIGSFFLELF